jgi:hypothetical protein
MSQTFIYLLPIIIIWELFEQNVLAQQNPFWSEHIYDTWIGDMFMGIMGWFASILISTEHRPVHLSGLFHGIVFVSIQISFYRIFEFEYKEMWGIAISFFFSTLLTWMLPLVLFYTTTALDLLFGSCCSQCIKNIRVGYMQRDEKLRDLLVFGILITLPLLLVMQVRGFIIPIVSITGTVIALLYKPIKAFTIKAFLKVNPTALIAPAPLRPKILSVVYRF